MKTPYTFSVLRYVHDIVTGEFVNIGIVLFAPKGNFLSAICTSKYRRLSGMFGSVNGEHIRSMSKYMQARLEEEGERIQEELLFEQMPKSVRCFAEKILPADDSSFQFSEEAGGLTLNPEKTLEELYDRYVERYSQKIVRASRTDEEVWRSFKKPLEERRVFANLVSHQIIGKNYDYEFSYGWQNGKWNLYEPVSFDLVEKGKIIDKAHVWFGKATSLAEGGEPFKLHLLLGAPSNNSLRPDFVKAQNILAKIECEHAVITEDQADEFAEKLKTEIDEYRQK